MVDGQDQAPTREPQEGEACQGSYRLALGLQALGGCAHSETYRESKISLRPLKFRKLGSYCKLFLWLNITVLVRFDHSDAKSCLTVQ
ncbi:hypothetical protein CDL15_Pgr019824 [Punica granatum]|uniref:Uncharacterized protein n=1 Tax=Punica granatum TaxID=22663 RepID=A0A218X6I1_PUNGR|nr:hypothetical protein CDL15_Pgr019824 [Punica granatum]